MSPETLSLLSLIISSITTVIIAVIGFYMKRLEKNTNSIKDELVEATRKLSYAAGVLAGKAEVKDG